MIHLQFVRKRPKLSVCSIIFTPKRPYYDDLFQSINDKQNGRKNTMLYWGAISQQLSNKQVFYTDEGGFVVFFILAIHNSVEAQLVWVRREVVQMD